MRNSQEFQYSRQEIQTQLEKDLPKQRLNTIENKENRNQVSYVQWWKVVEMANNIFGQDGWTNKILTLRIESVDFEKGFFYITASSHIRIELKDGTYHEDIGCVTVSDKKKYVAIQQAKKRCVADGVKRTLRLFGNNLGNSLRMREQRNSQLNKQFSQSQKSQFSDISQQSEMKDFNQLKDFNNLNNLKDCNELKDVRKSIEKIELKDLKEMKDLKDIKEKNVNNQKQSTQNTRSKRIVVSVPKQTFQQKRIQETIPSKPKQVVMLKKK